MPKRVALKSSLVLMLIVLIRAASIGAERPNIIFFLSDDQRWDQMGCAGHPVIKTPTMDRLAEQGTRFSNAFVTTSICAASRASIFTGLYERTHGYTFRTVPIRKQHSQQSYAALLKAAGYKTGFVGKFGVGVEDGAREEMFDFFLPIDRNPYHKNQKDGTTRHTTELAADAAISFMEDSSSDQPFCLSVSFNAPHAEDSDKENHFPWPKAMDGWYDDVTVDPPKLSDPKVYESQPDFLKNSLNRQRYFWRWDTPEKWQKNVKGYYRMISGVDHAMGRVLDALEKDGREKNTVILFAGDNGYYLGQRGFAGKWSHYEESLRVPLIVFDPRIDGPSGQVVDSIALNIDITATIVDYAQIPVPTSYQGRTLKPWVEGRTVDSWRTDFFCEHLMHFPGGIPKWEGIHGKRYAYARYFEQVPPFEFLHDLESDPDQLTNLATESSQSELLEQLRRRCNELRDAYGGEYSIEKFPLSSENKE